jgi:DNA polymerase III epsilon subunit-like protein
MTHFLEADNLMIDLETLAQRPDAAIMSIGVVHFKFNNGGLILNSFYTNVDARDCKKHGMRIEASTVSWWEKQSKDVIKALQDPKPIDLKSALTELSKWVGSTTKSPYVWSNGAAYDIPIMEIAYKNLDMESPWSYRNVMCYRTACNIAGISKSERDKNNEALHNALSDAKSQAKVLMGMLDEVPF